MPQNSAACDSEEPTAQADQSYRAHTTGQAAPGKLFGDKPLPGYGYAGNPGLSGRKQACSAKAAICPLLAVSHYLEIVGMM
jgi:hypothetical protein